MNIFRAYNRILHAHPFKTQCITTGTLVASGDIIAQKLIEKEPNLNWKRTAKFAVFGLVYVGPCISIWYPILDRRFGAAKNIILKPWQKVIIDQSFFNPSINFFALVVLGLLDGKSYSDIKQNIQKNYIDIMKASYQIWPAVQIVNFYVIPLHYRAVVVSVFSLIWNTFYTWKLGEKRH